MTPLNILVGRKPQQPPPQQQSYLPLNSSTRFQSPELYRITKQSLLTSPTRSKQQQQFAQYPNTHQALNNPHQPNTRVSFDFNTSSTATSKVRGTAQSIRGSLLNISQISFSALSGAGNITGNLAVSTSAGINTSTGTQIGSQSANLISYSTTGSHSQFIRPSINDFQIPLIKAVSESHSRRNNSAIKLQNLQNSSSIINTLSNSEGKRGNGLSVSLQSMIEKKMKYLEKNCPILNPKFAIENKDLMPARFLTLFDLDFVKSTSNLLSNQQSSQTNDDINHNSESGPVYLPAGTLEFNILELIEQIDKKITANLSSGCRIFEANYFDTLTGIIDEHIPPILLRINQQYQEQISGSSGSSSEIRCVKLVINYLRRFLKLFFGQIEIQMKEDVREKVKHEAAWYIREVDHLQEKIYDQNVAEPNKGLRIKELELQVTDLQNQLLAQRAKNALLEEQLKELSLKVEFEQIGGIMGEKISGLDEFINDLETQNVRVAQQLEERLCTLGDTLMDREQANRGFHRKIRKETSFPQTSTQTSLKDFFKIRLDAFFMNLSKAGLIRAPAAQIYMEYTLSHFDTEEEAFQEIEQTVHNLAFFADSEKAQFFATLFGILKYPLPTISAMLSMLDINLKLSQTLGVIYLDDSLSIATPELETILSESFHQPNLSQNQHEISALPDSRKLFESFYLTNLSDHEERQRMEIALGYFKKNPALNINMKTAKDIAGDLGVNSFFIFSYLLDLAKHHQFQEQKYQNYSKDQSSLSLLKAIGSVVKEIRIQQKLKCNNNQEEVRELGSPLQYGSNREGTNSGGVSPTSKLKRQASIGKTMRKFQNSLKLINVLGKERKNTRSSTVIPGSFAIQTGGTNSVAASGTASGSKKDLDNLSESPLFKRTITIM